MKVLSRLVFGLCTVGLLAGCGKEVDHEKIREKGFVYCGQGNPNTFNPQLVDSGITSESLSPQIFDTLLQLDSGTYRPTANLATHWKVDKSGTEYTFHLRPNVEFQTTEWFTPTRSLNAQDVVFSFQRIFDTSHPYHYVGGGLYPWFAGIDFQNSLVDVVALDDLTVKFTLSHPNNSFLNNIATSYAVIHSKEYANQLELEDEKGQLDAFPVGTGPFYLSEYQINDLVRLKKHDKYWKMRSRWTKLSLILHSVGPAH